MQDAQVGTIQHIANNAGWSDETLLGLLIDFMEARTGICDKMVWCDLVLHLANTATREAHPEPAEALDEEPPSPTESTT